MRYYDNKMRANNKLEKMILSQEEININVLYYDISKSFGFSKSFVDNFISVLVALGKVEILEETIINKTKGSKK